MSNLDNLLLKYGIAVLDLPRTNDPMGKPVDEAKAAIKELIYGLMTEAVHGPSGELRYSDLEELVKAL